MPPVAAEVAMTPEELKELIAVSKFSYLGPGELAELLGFSRSHWWRLVTGVTPINIRNARLIYLGLTKKEK